MKILSNTGGLAATNCFVIADESAGEAVLFDAPNDTVSPLLDQVEQHGWKLIGLWLTHGHWDHLADHAKVTERFPDAELLIHELDEPKLQQPGSTIMELPFEIPHRDADGHVTDGQKMRIGSLDVEVIETPGHSPGHVMFHIPAERVLVGGDLIICDAVGRTDLRDSDPAALVESVRRVMQLPDETTLLPGHCGVTTLGEQRQRNLFVRQILAGKGL